jgi:hypothetical protein
MSPTGDDEELDEGVRFDRPMDGGVMTRGVVGMCGEQLFLREQVYVRTDIRVIEDVILQIPNHLFFSALKTRFSST